MLRTLLGRYAPATVKNIARRAWQQVGPRPAAPLPRHLFVFGGRANFWAGMGRELYAHEPVFRATVRAGAEFIASQGGPTLLEQYEGEVAADYLTENRILFSLILMQLALVDLWRAKGVEPDAMMGISVGEIAAVYAAGGLSLPDALRVGLCAALIPDLEPAHGVLTATIDYTQASALTGSCPVPLFVMAITEAARCYLSCPLADMAAAKEYLRQQGVQCHRLQSQPIPAYHTTQLARHQEVMQQPLLPIQPLALARPCYLSTLGRLVPAGTVLGQEYWLQLMQHPTQLRAMVQAAQHDGYQLFTAVGPYPFPFMNAQAQQAALGEVQLLLTLTPGVDARESFAATRQTLAGLKLVRTPAVRPPELPVAAFLAQLSLRSPEFMANPHATFRMLRPLGGVHFLPTENSWLVLEAELANEVLKQPLVYSSLVNAEFDDQLVGADPPLHTGNRATAQPYFMPMRLATLADYTTTMVAELGGSLAGRPSFDFVTEFAIPLAQAVGGQLLGLTRAEQLDLQGRLPGHAYSLAYLGPLNQYFTEYFAQRQTPAEPVLLDQFLAQMRKGELTHEAALNLAKTMWLAGIATSSMLMSSAAYYLLQYPAVAAQLRAEPELVDNFVEEMLRLEPPVNFIWRNATQPVVLGGQALPTGSLVVLSVGAANRDPARLPNPDELDFRRRPVRHLAFGGGIHACMGAHLARLEVRIVVRWLLAQGPALRFTLPSMLPSYYPNIHFRALAHLPLTLQFSPAPDAS